MAGTWPDDFEVRLDIPGTTQSRVLPLSFFSLLPGPPAASRVLTSETPPDETRQDTDTASSAYALALPLAFARDFLSSAPTPPTALELSLYVYFSAFEWAAQKGEPCAPLAGLSAPPAVTAATAPLPLPLPFPPSFAPAPPPALPLPRCTLARGPGRWLPSTHPLRGGLGPSDEGLVWVGDDATCALRAFTGEEVDACFAALFPQGSLILWLGDSNIRREYKTLKGFAAPGSGAATDSAWCSGRRGDPTCQCSDSEERGEYDGNFGASFPLGGCTVQTFFIPGVHDSPEGDLPTWRAVLYGSLLPSMRAGAPLGAVVFTLAHWEPMQDSFWSYVGEVEAFASALADLATEQPQGAPPPLYIYRRPNYMQLLPNLGQPQEAGRYDTHGRAALFTRAADAVLARVLGSSLVVWDVQGMQEGKPWQAHMAHHDTCSALGRAQHPSSEDHELGVQLLFHQLCAQR